MRKQKIEAELKEVQNKPTISTRSRKLAEKAELKVFNSIKPKEIPKDSKALCEEEMIELEQDIQMLEACLSLNEQKYQTKTFEDSNLPMFETSSVDKPHFQTIVARVKQMGRKSDSPVVKSGILVSQETKKSTMSPARVPNASPQRKFIKEKSPKVSKYRSVSMETLNSMQFCYRSLSPFQITLKRTIENS